MSIIRSLREEEPVDKLHEEELQRREDEMLAKKFAPKKYSEKYATLYMINTFMSWVFSLLSWVTASTIVYWFMEEMVGIPALSVAVTILVIVAFGMTARYMNSIHWQDQVQYGKNNKRLLLGVVFFSVMMAWASWEGAKKTVVELSADPELIALDEALKPLYEELATINDQIAKAEQTQWNGTTIGEASKAKTILAKQKLLISEQLISKEKEIMGNNSAKLAVHQATTALKAHHFAMITIFLEIILVFTLWYTEYYLFRKYKERKAEIAAAVAGSTP